MSRIDYNRSQPTNRYLDNSHTKETHNDEMRYLRSLTTSNQRAYHRHLEKLCEERGIRPSDYKTSITYRGIRSSINYMIDKLLEAGLTPDDVKPRDSFCFDKNGNVVRKSAIRKKDFADKFEQIDIGGGVMRWRRKQRNETS